MAKILVVDDDPSIVKVLELVLARVGYEVAVATNGKEGLAAARQEKPDLIILDLMMPEIDGVTASGILFQDPVLRLTPVLILTAKESARQMMDLVPNVRLYLSKPFDPPELLKSVQRLLAAPPA
jgi:two-component system, OmpR family, alkaline phosphatase synthesis response regulator PhoP